MDLSPNPADALKGGTHWSRTSPSPLKGFTRSLVWKSHLTADVFKRLHGENSNILVTPNRDTQLNHTHEYFTLFISGLRRRTTPHYHNADRPSIPDEKQQTMAASYIYIYMTLLFSPQGPGAQHRESCDQSREVAGVVLGLGEVRGGGGGQRCQAYNWGEEISWVDRRKRY